MLLSEAIRLGSMATDQLFDEFFDGFESVESTCAMGAAAYAVGFKVKCDREYGADWDIDGLDKLFSDNWPYAVEYRQYFCPKCGTCITCMEQMVVHLNDNEKWSREKIADWVEQREKELGLIQPPAQVKEEITAEVETCC